MYRSTPPTKKRKPFAMLRHAPTHKISPVAWWVANRGKGNANTVLHSSSSRQSSSLLHVICTVAMHETHDELLTFSLLQSVLRWLQPLWCTSDEGGTLRTPWELLENTNESSAAFKCSDVQMMFSNEVQSLSMTVNDCAASRSETKIGKRPAGPWDSGRCPRPQWSHWPLRPCFERNKGGSLGWGFSGSPNSLHPNMYPSARTHSRVIYGNCFITSSTAQGGGGSFKDRTL